MQLVLLSGGSGKRLWPLSNNARSKQFLPLLQREDGAIESMVQRVVRQICEAHLACDITLATNASQQDIILNQLGESVGLVTEPERRDTFPAIALAASFLKFEKRCADDEVVVVMPCDPYTEAGYFETIGKMAECVRQNVADLVLMGIRPTYPSEKYGYIIPETAETLEPSETFKRVARFTEKPTVSVAEELLKQNAYWNGGVFAFKLGYMLDIVEKYMPIAREVFTDNSRVIHDNSRSEKITDFASIRARYSELPKISFDYEVAEKAESVAVVPFAGAWKDLGTWNTLTDELHTSAIGNAVMGAHCNNAHVINETQLPIYVDGLTDMVVAASPDGILVCSKEHAEEIKKEVENLSPRPMYEERRWGTYRVLDDSTYADGKHSLTKSVTILPGKNISYQMHSHRTEVWTVVEGNGVYVLDGIEKPLSVGDSVSIPVGHWHAIKALSQLTFIEVQLGDPLIEEDIIRSEWKWGNEI